MNEEQVTPAEFLDLRTLMKEGKFSMCIPTLKACPFCNTPSYGPTEYNPERPLVALHGVKMPTVKKEWVLFASCTSCGGSGPRRTIREDLLETLEYESCGAVEAWNKRA